MGEGETSCGVGSRNRTDCIGRIDNIGDGNFAGALWPYCCIAILLYVEIWRFMGIEMWS